MSVIIETILLFIGLNLECYKIDFKILLVLYYKMSETINHNKVATKIKVNECKKYNDMLWSCIETHNYTVKYCGKEYYKFFKCFNTIRY